MPTNDSCDKYELSELRTVCYVFMPEYVLHYLISIFCLFRSQMFFQKMFLYTSQILQENIFFFTERVRWLFQFFLNILDSNIVT